MIYLLPILSVWLYIPLPSQRMHHLGRLDEYLKIVTHKFASLTSEHASIPIKNSALLPILSVWLYIPLPSQGENYLRRLDEHLSMIWANRATKIRKS